MTCKGFVWHKSLLKITRSVDAGHLHDSQELLLVDLTVAVLVELVDHGGELLVGKVLSELASNSAQVSQRDLSCVVLVKKLESLESLLHGVAVLDLLFHDLNKVVVLNLVGSVAVVLAHQTKNFLLLHIEAESAHGNLQLVVVNGAGLVSVEEVKGLLDFLLLFFGKLLALAASDGLFGSKEFRLLEHFSNLKLYRFKSPQTPFCSAFELAYLCGDLINVTGINWCLIAIL